MNELSTKQLFSQLQEKLILNLGENETLCPECKGLKMVLVEFNGRGYIESCKSCYTGKLTVCKHCGKGNKSWCDCKESMQERNNEFQSKQMQKEFKAYEKAEKIHYKDYDGKFWIESYSSNIIEIDEVEEWIYETLQNGEEPPDYLWSIKGIPHFSINLLDVIYDKCEEGYEDMYDNLDIKSEYLVQAQTFIDKWEEQQGERLFSYTENYKKAVIIKDLVEEIRKEIKGK